jgi:hypothetical protein
MANAIQLKRGNTAGTAPASLADGEVAVQQTDGVLFWRTTAAAVQRLLLPKRKPIADAAYTVAVTDTYVGVSSLTAARTITLPAASGYPVGHVLTVTDEAGACSSSLTVTITAAGSDTINGVASLVLAVPRFSVRLTSDGTSKWTAAGRGVAVVGDASAATVLGTGPLQSVSAAIAGRWAVFSDRTALLAGNVGTATHVHCLRYYPTGPVANIVYEIVSTAPTGRDVITSPAQANTTVNATDASGNAVTKYIKLAVNQPTPEMFGAYGDAAPMAFTLSDTTYTTAKAAEHDDTAALQAQINYLNNGDAWVSGGQNRHYAVSSTLTFQKYRCVVDFGTLVPYGSFSGFLIAFSGGQGADPTMPNVAMTMEMKRLRLVGRWQSRGASFANLYMSTLTGFMATHCYGSALTLDDSYENSWIKPVFALNKNRVSVDVSGAVGVTGGSLNGLWSPANAYTVGAIVRPQVTNAANAQLYSGTATYAINDLVYSADGNGVYRSLVSGNVGNALTANGPNWVRDEIEWYQCKIAQVANANPAANPISGTTDYTTASPTAANRVWDRVFPNEPLIDLTNRIGAVVDHEYFWGMDIRDNSNLEFMRVDQAGAGQGGGFRPMVAIELHGCHFESMTPGVPAATGGQLGASDSVARANATYLRLSHSQRCKLSNTTIRIGGSGSTAIRLGGQHPLNGVSELHIQNVDINGEDPYLIGVYTGISVQDLQQAVGSINFALTDATALKLVDPAQRLSDSSALVPLRLPDGSISRPVLTTASDIATGLYRRGSGVWAFSAAGTPTISFGPTPATSDSSDRAATTLFVKSVLAAQTGTLATPGTFAFYGGLILKWGSSVVTTDASGNATIAYSTAFPSGTAVVMPINGDSGTAPQMILSAVASTTNASQFGVHASTNTAAIASTTVRINWIAVGY